MIRTLEIRGFKSVRDIHLECRRINLFIGEPNTGKSNILEALGFLSWCARGGALSDYVRLGQVRNLFYDGMPAQGGWGIKLTAEQGVVEINAWHNKGSFQFGLQVPGRSFPLHDGLVSPGQIHNPNQKQFDFVRFYRFQTLARYPSDETGYLLPPKGENLVTLLSSSKDLRRLAGEYFAPSGMLFVVKPHEHEIEIQKQTEGVALGLPYWLSSDTLQRVLFHMAAIESNNNATVVFEEPETHSFPYYVKHLAERIALDENKNQYFIATHNPYLLTSMWEKSAADEIAVFATYYRDYETRVKLLTEDDMASLMEGDPFFGVAHLVKDAL